jgi:hypothetical protein
MLLALWLLLSATPMAHAQPRRAVDDLAMRERLVALAGSVLRIEVRRAQGGYGFGSGVVLPGERIVTNCHVTRDGVAVNVLRGGARWQAQSQAALPELDLCVLHVPGMIGSPVELAQADGLAVGSKVAAIGYMVGAPTPSMSEGVVVDLHRHRGASVIQSTSGFVSGASGGGLFDERGALAGILTFRLRGISDAHFFAAPVAWLRPLLADASRFKPVAPLAPTLSYWEERSDAQPRFLRALSMAYAGTWDRLLGLASGWARDDEYEPHAHFWLGMALQRLARPDEAVAPLERAVVLAPRWDAPLEFLGLSEIDRGRFASARGILERLRPLNDAAADRLRHALARACARESAVASGTTASAADRCT